MSASVAQDEAFIFEGFKRSGSSVSVRNDILDTLMPQLSEVEFKVLMYVIRQMARQQKEAVAIPLKQMVHGNGAAEGTGLSHSSVWRGVKGLEAKHILSVYKTESAIGGVDANVYTWHGAPVPEIVRPIDTRSPVPKRKSIPGFIYLLKGGGYYKIGRTSNLAMRLRSFELAFPFPVTLEHTIATDDMIVLESSLHQQFSSQRINGEWFALTDADVKLFKATGK